jgi:hypothetical protein
VHLPCSIPSTIMPLMSSNSVRNDIWASLTHTETRPS